MSRPRTERPTNAVVGATIPHESAALHVTGAALYTDDLVIRHQDVCTPTRSRPRTRTPG